MTQARRNGLLLTLLLVGQLLLMTGSVRRADGSTQLEAMLLGVSSSVVSVAHAVGGGVTDLFTGFGELREAREENARLKEELRRARLELERAREQTMENERLARLLVMKDHMLPESVGARVVTANLSDEQHVVVIDRGLADGVKPDLPVMAWGGVVGRVVLATESRAKVRLLTDPWSSVAGLSQRSRQHGMIRGRGGGLLEMLYVPSYADVAQGDRIVTAGIDGVFPKGFGIGRVVQIAEKSGIAKSILVEPEVDLSRLEEVLVVVGGPAAELPATGDGS